MADDFDGNHPAPSFPPLASAPVTEPAAEIVSPALAGFTRPPKVGDVIVHDGHDVTITGTQLRGPGDFSVIVESGETLRSR